MINCYSESIKYPFRVKSLISNFAKDLFEVANQELAAKRVTCISASTTLAKKSIILFVICLLMLTGIGSVNAASFYSITSGNWNATSTWSTSSGGAAGASVPVDGDDVTIERGCTVTVTTAASCSSIAFSANNSNNTLVINSTVLLTVSGAITVPMAGSGAINTISVGAGNLNAASIAFTNGGNPVRHKLTISTGTVTVTGNVTTDNTGPSATIAVANSGTLILGGSLLANGGGTLTTVPGSTVIYNAAGAQTISNFTYSNLTLSGGGVKTTATGVTVNGILSMEGSATTTGTVATYGSAATLQYRGSIAQTTGIEFPASFYGTGGVIINNANGVTFTNAKNMNYLVITSGSTVNLGTFAHTVGLLSLGVDTYSSGVYGGTGSTGPGVITNTTYFKLNAGYVTITNTIVQLFSATTTFNVPCGVTSVTAEVWGGGGAGGRLIHNGNSSGGGGGGGGAYSGST